MPPSTGRGRSRWRDTGRRAPPRPSSGAAPSAGTGSPGSPVSTTPRGAVSSAWTTPQTAAWITGYVDGVNAGLDEGARRAPAVRVDRSRTDPWQPWTPLGVWLRTHILFAGFPTKLWREEVARALGEDAIDLFATDGLAPPGSNGWLVDGDAPRAAPRSSPATRTGSSRTRASTSRSIWPARSSTSSASPCRGSPASPTSATPARSPGPSPTPWPTTRTSTASACAGPRRRQLEALGPDGWRPVSVHSETIEVADADPVDRRGDRDRTRPRHRSAAPAEAESISLRIRPACHRETSGSTHCPHCCGPARSTMWTGPSTVGRAGQCGPGRRHRGRGAAPRGGTRPGAPPRQHARGRARVGAGSRLGRLARVTATARRRHRRDGQRAGIAGPLGVEFAPPHRAERIRTLLHEQHSWTAAGMAAVHMDTQLASANHCWARRRRSTG